MSLVRIRRDPSARDLRVFGVALAVVAGLGVRSLLRHDLPTLAWGVVGLGGLGLLLAVAAPRVLRPAFVGLSLLTYPIGLVVSTVLLGVIYFGLLGPVALVMRALGRDKLGMRFDPSRATYFEARDGDPPRERYFRQF